MTTRRVGQVLAAVLAEIKNCGVRDVCMLVCGGLKRLPDAVSTVWGEDHRANMHCPSSTEFIKVYIERRRAQIAKTLKPVYTAASGAEALDRFTGFSGKMGEALPGYHPAVGERIG